MLVPNDSTALGAEVLAAREREVATACDTFLSAVVGLASLTPVYGVAPLGIDHGLGRRYLIVRVPDDCEASWPLPSDP